ncbi:hypothetical protein FOA43_000204 [Brettanomyces nanus]|uniref:C3H1-type domain-containing protein n=1 Tax=Eeniella nana TaxID=13502 RepID=A0A875RVH6_EENNA|nr:uncharacterized protein FOA43_000204 [Brettanomyces nanus]QPG72901.1 hypothetical protein FOA43_000204 [Brettanomyces nanus]
MNKEQQLQQDLVKLKDGINSKRQEINKQLKLRQQELSKQQDILRERLSGHTAPKSTISKRKRISNSEKPSAASLSSSKKAQIEIRKLKALGKAKKALFKYIYQNRIKYNYKNRILIKGLKYVPIHGLNSLALTSTENEDTHKELTSIDDLDLWVSYQGKNYVKDYSGKYNLQSRDWIMNPPSEDCIYYMRAGHCENRKCKYLHDPDHVALCPNILLSQRRCTKSHCCMSHKPSQFNAPSCNFFQEGSCTNVNCIYSHKLENGSDIAICRPFSMNGYCKMGRKCTYRHFFDCPDLQEYGYCIRGRGCHLNHSFLLKTGQESLEPIRNTDNDDVVVYFDDNKDLDNPTDSLGDVMLRTLSTSDLSSKDGDHIQQDQVDTNFSTNADFVSL